MGCSWYSQLLACAFALLCFLCSLFQSTPVDTFNVLSVSIVNSSFVNNRMTSLSEQYRAASGGLSISFHFQTKPNINPLLHISDCHFFNNTVIVNPTLFNEAELVLNEQLYPDRGGGMSIVISEGLANVSVMIEGCIFERNKAEEFGGGLFIAMDSTRANHTVIIEGTEFLQNDAGSEDDGIGGGVAIGFLGRNSVEFSSTVRILDCCFIRNSAATAGGLMVMQSNQQSSSNVIDLARTIFTDNVALSEGSALLFGSLMSIESLQFAYSIITDW